MDAIDYTDDYLLTRFLSFVNVRSSTRDSLLSLPLSKCEVDAQSRPLSHLFLHLSLGLDGFYLIFSSIFLLQVFTRDSARATPVKGKTDIEDDQETVLDITGKSSKLTCKSE